MNNNFDNEFQAFLTELIELSFEFVDNNVEEVDAVYVIGLIEKGYFFKSFYRINESLVKAHNVNSVSKAQYDLSDTRTFSLLDLGNETLNKIEDLFKEADREVPTSLKLIYYPKSGKFESEFGYKPTFSNSKSKIAQHVYEDWYNEIEKS